jgi:hypothetical protein
MVTRSTMPPGAKRSTSMMPAVSSSVMVVTSPASLSRPVSARAKTVAMVGCPASGISVLGVKYRAPKSAFRERTTRDGQHGGVVQIVGIEQDGTGVAGQPGRGEGVDLHEGIGTHDKDSVAPLLRDFGDPLSGAQAIESARIIET